MTKDTKPRSKKSEALVPDQVLTREDLQALRLNDAMRRCPGHEYLEDEDRLHQPNWPPSKRRWWKK